VSSVSKLRQFIFLVALGILIFLSLHLLNSKPVTAQVASLNKSFSPATINPGENSTLTVVLYNSSTTPLTNAAVTDNFPTGMTIANPANVVNNCGGTITADPGTNFFSLSGGTVGRRVGITDGQCSISVKVTTTIQGNLINTIPANALTNDQNQKNGSPASATLQVRSVASPSLSKNFSPNTIFAGQTANLRITITNNATISLTNVGITDNLPANVTVNGTPTTTCTGGSITTTATSVTLAGGSISPTGASGTCQIDIPVTSITAGSYTNTLPIKSLSNTQGVSNTSAATASLNVQTTIVAPTLTKSFSSNSVLLSTTPTLRISIRNNALISLTNVSVTDNLPAGLTVNGTITKDINCQGGTLSNTATTATITGTTIAAGATCLVTVPVKATAAGAYTNTIPANSITADQGVTNSGAASATIRFEALRVTKAFSSSTTSPNVPVTLTVTLSNATTSSLAGAAFTDNLPAGMTVANPANATTTCTGGTVTATPGASSFSLAGGTIRAGTCTVSVSVVTSTAASYTNTIPIGGVTTSGGISNILAGSASLNTSNNTVTLAKAFTPATVNTNQNSRLRITINVPNTNTIGVTGLSLTDAFPNNLVIASNPNPFTNCTGGNVSAIAGSSSVAIAGVSINKNANCYFEVDVVSSVQGTYTNDIPIGALTTNEGISNSNAPSAALTVVGIKITKKFFPNTIAPNGRSTLVVTLTNNLTFPITGVRLTDNLTQTGSAIKVASPPNAKTTCGSGTVAATANGTNFTLNNATIPAAVLGIPGICTFEVDVTGTASSGTNTNIIPVNALTSTEGITNPEAATDTLNFSTLNLFVNKDFNPLTVSGGSTSTMTVTLTNPSSTQTYTGTTFTDNMPAGMQVAAPADATTTCTNGTITATPGANNFSLSGGEISPNSSCTVSLKVTSAQTGNLTNTIPINGVTTFQGAKNTQVASASLTNLPALGIGKVFNPSVIEPNSISRLTIAIINANSDALANISLTDSLPAGVTVAQSSNATTDCGTGQVITTTTEISLSAGVLGANSSCTFSVDVTASALGTYINNIPAEAIASNLGVTNSNSARAILTVSFAPTVSKSFSPASIKPGNISTLTIELGNRNNSAIALTSLLRDTLPTGIAIANPPDLGGTCTLANITATAGSNTITYASGSNIPVGGCTITVKVTSASAGTYTNTIAAGDLKTTTGSNINAATTDIKVYLGSKLILVKRITAINDTTASDGGDNLGTYINEAGKTDDDPSNPWPLPLANYLRGGIDGGQVQSRDRVEYTIYFLSNGDEKAVNVKICDLIPDKTELISNAFNPNSGIALAFDPINSPPAQPPTTPTKYLTNNSGDDEGEYVLANTTPSAQCNGSNTNGAVVVSLNVVPNANSPGVPLNSYGFVRFRVRVK
jgi:trimeric autotransporter adhesin